jgi:hypothetical protein
LGHHERRHDGQGDQVETAIELTIGAIKQNRRDHPRKIARSEP